MIWLCRLTSRILGLISTKLVLNSVSELPVHLAKENGTVFGSTKKALSIIVSKSQVARPLGRRNQPFKLSMCSGKPSDTRANTAGKDMFSPRHTFLLEVCPAVHGSLHSARFFG